MNTKRWKDDDERIDETTRGSKLMTKKQNNQKFKEVQKN